jgi:hypothetical protein
VGLQRDKRKGERETSASGGDGQRSRVGAGKGGSSARNGGKSKPKMGGDRPAVEMGRDRGSSATNSAAGKAQALVKVSVLPTVKALVRPETHFLAVEKTLSYLLLNLLFGSGVCSVGWV